MKHLSPVALLLALPMTAALTAHTARGQSPLRPAECRPVPQAATAECFLLSVPEQAGSQGGRLIDLHITRLRSTGGGDAPPVFPLSGGPGQAAGDGQARYAQSPLRANHDIVLVDQRGTGRSHALGCAPRSADQLLGPLFILDNIKACRDSLSRTSDLRQYTTIQAVADLDAVRQALGYERILVSGTSYGTRMALAYTRAYPAHVAGMVLMGVAPPDFALPLTYPRDAQLAVDGLFADCRGDAACAAAFPELQQQFERMLTGLRQSPATVRVQPFRSDTVNATFTHDGALEAVRSMLYTPASARLLPHFIARAASGDYRPMAQWLLNYRQGLDAGISNGMHLAITCSEDMPQISIPKAEQAASGSFLGTYRLSQYVGACRGWPSAKVPASYTAPVSSAVPTLLVTGQYDPATGPLWAAQVAQRLTHSVNLVVPHSGHGHSGLDGATCVETIVNKFLDQPDPTKVDSACLREAKRPPFDIPGRE